MVIVYDLSAGRQRQLARILWDFAYLCWANTMVAWAGCLPMPLLRHHLARFSAKLFAINSSRIPPQHKPPSGAKSGLESQKARFACLSDGSAPDFSQSPIKSGHHLNSKRRFDVLIQMEQIFWIILFFDLCQAIIVGAVSGGHPIAFFFRHEVHVGALRGVWSRGLEKRAGPSNAPLIVCSLIPSSVHIEHKLWVPMTICHGIFRNAIGCARNEPNEDLALCRG